jgi:hypothetical protein
VHGFVHEGPTFIVQRWPGPRFSEAAAQIAAHS